MTILKTKDNIYQIGNDFGDAVTGKLVCHGELEASHGERRHWVSTLPIAETEHGLRLAAQKEGKTITYFMSQRSN